MEQHTRCCTADTSIGDFARDLDVSLDQAYVEYHNGNLRLVGGKFPKPFLSTELVWDGDGDVNPQGVGGHYQFFGNDTVSAQLAAVYFAISESASPTSADMLGSQLALTWRPRKDWNLSLGLSYFDYDISKVEPGLPGGARGNNMSADGVTYVSDFDLPDTTVAIDYFGLGDRWPLKVAYDVCPIAGKVQHNLRCQDLQGMHVP